MYMIACTFRCIIRINSCTSLSIYFLQEVRKVFVHLPELYGLSVQLLASLDECMEMAGEVEGVARCTLAGFVFEEIAEVRNAFMSLLCILASVLDRVYIIHNILFQLPSLDSCRDALASYSVTTPSLVPFLKLILSV